MVKNAISLRGVGVGAGAFVNVGEGVRVGMLVGVFVGVAVGVAVSVLVGVAVLVGVVVAVGNGVALGTGVGVSTGTGVQAGKIRLTSKSTINVRFIGCILPKIIMANTVGRCLLSTKILSSDHLHCGKGQFASVQNLQIGNEGGLVDLAQIPLFSLIIQ